MTGSGAEANHTALPASLLLAGAGKMGGALLAGWLQIGFEPHRIVVIDPHAPESVLDRLASQGVSVNPAERSAPPDIMVLAIKPQSLEAAASSLSMLAGPDTLLLSIVAGKTIADLARAFPRVRAIARAMPNTPAAVGRGITGIAVNDAVSGPQRAGIDALLGAVGAVEWLPDESLIDAVTAVSGSGPAYLFYMTECLAKAAEAVGLSPDAALRLARATVEGAGALMAATPDMSPSRLRENVTSPGGTTAAALAVLMADDRLQRAMTEAVEAARNRAGALAG